MDGGRLIESACVSERPGLLRRGEGQGLQVYIPPKGLCTDNAVMIGSAGFYCLMAGELADLNLNAVPALRMIEAQGE